MKPLFFATAAAWRRWLAGHHKSHSEVWVGLHKKKSGRASITWPEAVDEALCFGWIDGIRKNLDEHSYVIRFTPRRAASKWSNINVRRVRELIRIGRMRQSGLDAFRRRTSDKTGTYSFEQRKTPTLPPSYVHQLKANEKAWTFFRAQPPWYQRTAAWWIISTKRDDTKLRRLATLIEDSAHGRTIAPLTRPPKSTKI
jgi:uncharacterized protein YdeI (YjbR/CyaY-like superfamily)